MRNFHPKKKFCYSCGKKLGRDRWILFPWRPNVVAGIKIGPVNFEIVGYLCKDCHIAKFEAEEC